MPYYEARVQAYIDTRTDENGKIYGPPAKWKNLAAAIRAIWLSDRRKQGSGMPQPPKPKETPSERFERAKAILLVRIHERNSWLTDKMMHHHNAECQGGKVCRYAENKEPALATLPEIIERLKNE